MPNAIGFATQGLRQRVGGQVVSGTASETAPLLGTAETGAGGTLATGGGLTASAVGAGVAVGVGSAVWNNQHSKNVGQARNFGSGNTHTNTITKLGASAHAKDLALAKAYDKQHKAKADALAKARKRSFTMGTQMNNRMRNINSGHGPRNPMKTDDIPKFQGPKQPKPKPPKNPKQLTQDANQISVLRSINSHNQKLGELYVKMNDLSAKYDKDGNATTDDILGYYQDLLALKADANKNAQEFYHKKHPAFTEANYGAGWKSVKQQYDGQVNIFQHEDGNFQAQIDIEVARYKNRLSALKFGDVQEPADISEHVANLRVIRLINRESPALTGPSKKDLLTNNKAQDLKVYKMIKGLNFKLLTDKKKQAEMKAFRDEAVKNKAQFSNYTDPIEILFMGDSMRGGGGFLDKEAFGNNSYDEKIVQLRTYIVEYNEKYAVKFQPPLKETDFNYEELIKGDERLDKEHKPHSLNDYISNQLLHMGAKTLSMGLGSYLGYNGITDLGEYRQYNPQEALDKIQVAEQRIANARQTINDLESDPASAPSDPLAPVRSMDTQAGGEPEVEGGQRLRRPPNFDDPRLRQQELMSERRSRENRVIDREGRKRIVDNNKKIRNNENKIEKLRQEIKTGKDSGVLDKILKEPIKVGGGLVGGYNAGYLYDNYGRPLLNVLTADPVAPRPKTDPIEVVAVKKKIVYKRKPIATELRQNTTKPRNTYHDMKYSYPATKPHRQFKEVKEKLTFDEMIYINEGKNGLYKCQSRGYNIIHDPMSWNEFQEENKNPKLVSYCKDKLNFKKEVNSYSNFKPIA